MVINGENHWICLKKNMDGTTNRNFLENADSFQHHYNSLHRQLEIVIA